MIEKSLDPTRYGPKESASKRYLFFADSRRLSVDALEVWLKCHGAGVLRRLRGGEILAYVDEGLLERLRREHPEVTAEPDVLLTAAVTS